MRKKAPVLAALAFVALIVYVLVGTLRDPRLPAAPGPAPEPDGCRLEGEVLDPDGAPLAGVPVLARRLETGAVFTARGETDGAGRFALRLFPPRGDWELRPEPPGRPPFGGPPVAATPGGRVEVVLTEPRPGEATVAAAPDGEVPPNVAGEVSDREGRSVAGARVEVLSASKEVLAWAATDEHGRFAMTVAAAPPISIRLAPGGEPRKLRTLPRLDVQLHVPHEEPARDRLTVALRLLGSFADRGAEVVLYDSLGQAVAHFWGDLSESPYFLDRIPYAVYDVRVAAPGLAGAVQGFDFRPDNLQVTVPLGRGARVRGSLDRPAEALLISASPTLVRRADWLRECDGREGVVRSVWASSREDPEGPKLSEFDFDRLPAGKYRLRLLGTGVEPREIEIELADEENLDLGRIELEEARASLHVRIRDREGMSANEFGYRVTLYDGRGLKLTRELPPGSTDDLVFGRLPAGPWRYRVERRLDRTHTRSVGRDSRLTLAPNEEREVGVDATWRIE